MAPFRFRLEQVRLYRKQLEEQAMQALAEAVMQRDALVERINALSLVAGEQRARLCRPDSMQGGERWVTQSYLDGLVQDIRLAGRQLCEAENHVDVCRTALVERAKEQKNNDETATLRYKPAAV